MGPFIADNHTWDLKYGRKTPIIDDRDRIARYGSGFSKLLAIAATGPIERTLFESRMSATTTKNEDSIMVPADEDILNIEELIPDQRAVYGYHRPEIRTPPEPMSHHQAMRKYR